MSFKNLVLRFPFFRLVSNCFLLSFIQGFIVAWTVNIYCTCVQCVYTYVHKLYIDADTHSIYNNTTVGWQVCQEHLLVVWGVINVEFNLLRFVWWAKLVIQYVIGGKIELGFTICNQNKGELVVETWGRGLQLR